MFTVLRQTEERAETERPHRFFALFKKISQKKRKTCTHLSKTVDGTFKKGFTLAFVLLHKLTPAPKLYFGLKQSFFCVLTDVFLLFF
jgi:hypothetical protein